jgi:hypothetical protein
MEACYRARRIAGSVSICSEVVAKILTMTPKLKLNDDARKTLLSCILKFLLLGMQRTRISTHMILAPRVQAILVIL